MGWFESQIQERQRFDSAAVESAMAGLAEALVGIGGAYASNRAASDAVADVLAYFGMRAQGDALGGSDALDHLEAHGIMWREVTLTPRWHREAQGPLLALREDGTPVVLLPRLAGGYIWRDHVAGRDVPVTGDGLADIRERALLLYRPLPNRPLASRDVLRFSMGSVSTLDWLLMAFAAAVASLLGLALPVAGAYLFGPLLSEGAFVPIVYVAAMLASIACAQTLVTSMRVMLSARIETRISIDLSAALMMRALNLPASFYKMTSAGEIARRIASAEEAVALFQRIVLDAGFTALFSLTYLVQIATMAPQLLGVGMCAVAAQVIALAAVARAQSRAYTELLEWRGRRNGWEFSLLGGMQKIRLAGAERRAFALWAEVLRHEVALAYRGPAPMRYAQTLQTAASLAGMFAFYLVASMSGMDAAAFLSFTVAYGALSGALSAFGSVTVEGACIKPLFFMAEPLFAAVPETAERRVSVARLRGRIELDNVGFSYGPEMPPVLDGLSLVIRPGEYVGIVGRTGCGKSTLINLLLGFERPQKGAVYYDGQNLEMLDARSVRRCMGTVLQNGRLFQGDIFSNIAVSAPGLTLDEAWRAAELAGISDDIRAMPMGMGTFVGEGSASISGGQRQRILIARALADNPQILVFDEATSALDNISQRAVSAALAGLKCTRITVAHRLSTVRQCDRIVVLGEGRVLEQGTYEELMALNGEFCELVRLQMA